MKLLGLDIGDRWVGVAISDALGISCRPLETILLENVEDFLGKTIDQEEITSIVVGYPVTLAGVQSEQTKKVVTIKEKLEETFQNKKINWILWDERLSSKRAQLVQRRVHTKEAKKEEHAIAASFILQSYLDYLAFQKNI